MADLPFENQFSLKLGEGDQNDNDKSDKISLSRATQLNITYQNQ